MAKLPLTLIIFRCFYAFRFLSVGHSRKIQTKLRYASPDELSAVKSKILGVEYCLANFGEIVILETGEKNAVMTYMNFGFDGLVNQLDQLRTEIWLHHGARKIGKMKKEYDARKWLIQYCKNKKNGHIKAYGGYGRFLV